MKKHMKDIIPIAIVACVIASTIPTYATNNNNEIYNNYYNYTNNNESDDDIIINDQTPPAPTPAPAEPTPSPTPEPAPAETPITIENVKNAYYTVSFNKNGSSDKFQPITVLANNAVGTLPTPKERKGYDFKGWFNGDTQVTKDTVVTSNMTLTAKWVDNGSTKYTIVQEIEKLDGSFEKYKTIEKTGHINESIDVTPDEIKGFKTPDNQTIIINEDESSQVVFQYMRKSYKIDLNVKDGITSKQKNFTYKYEESVTLDVSLKNDYSDLTITGGVSDKTFKMPAKDLKLTVSAKPTEYKLIYRGNGIDTTRLKQTYNLNTIPLKLEKPKIKSKLWTFHGWKYDGQKITEITDTNHKDMVINADVTFNAVYLIIPLCVIGCIGITTGIYIYRRKKYAPKHKKGSKKK